MSPSLILRADKSLDQGEGGGWMDQRPAIIYAQRHARDVDFRCTCALLSRHVTRGIYALSVFYSVVGTPCIFAMATDIGKEG